jgi:transcriptional regulator of aromatic amino acid metabolism
MLDAYEEHLLRQALDQSPTMRELAWRLRVSVPTLWRKLRRHRIYPVRPEL